MQIPTWFWSVLAGVLVVTAGAGVVTTQQSESVPSWATSDLTSEKAPDFSLETLRGDPFRLSEHRGEVVVLNFWATWCPPCREEIPMFVDLQRELGDEGLQFVGVALERSAGPEKVRAFAEKMNINYPIGMGTGRIAKKYSGVRGLPMTFIIGPDGTVEGEGGVRRDVEPVVAMCSMDEYEVSEPPANYELPSADEVPEQTGEFGNPMVQLIAGGQVIGGIALLGAFILRLVETVVAPVVGGLFLVVGIGLFALVANARLSDRFRAEQYRSRLRAVEAGGIDRPEIEGTEEATDSKREPPQRADNHETEAS